VKLLPREIIYAYGIIATVLRQMHGNKLHFLYFEGNMLNNSIIACTYIYRALSFCKLAVCSYHNQSIGWDPLICLQRHLTNRVATRQVFSTSTMHFYSNLGLRTYFIWEFLWE